MISIIFRVLRKQRPAKEPEKRTVKVGKPQREWEMDTGRLHTLFTWGTHCFWELLEPGNPAWIFPWGKQLRNREVSKDLWSLSDKIGDLSGPRHVASFSLKICPVLKMYGLGRLQN